MLRFAVAPLLALALVSPVDASALREPHMHIVAVGDAPEVALTLDACMGAVDMRVLNTLIDNKVPATIFATRRWLRDNPDAIHLLVLHPDLFEIEDHGADHLPAVIGIQRPYGLTAAGTASAVRAEVLNGAAAVADAAGRTPQWYRGAAALYTDDALALIAGLGYRVGGFSLNGDLGASASTGKARRLVASAHSGDVIIAHINQPTRPAGAGVAEGVLDLLAKGFRFVRLEDVTEVAD